MPDPKLIPLDTVMQRTGHDCGPAVARSVLTRFGRPWVRVDQTCRPHPKDGTPPERLAWLLQLHGLGTVAQSGMTADHLRHLTGKGWPVLCPVQYRGAGHWVAVRGCDKRHVHVMDPAAGCVPVPVADFVRDWHAAAPDGTKLVRYGLAVYEPA